VPVNCGAIPETILESELFGHRKGAFTGAVSDKKGLLEEAHGGTLFLDEVGDMSAAMQVKLLRFLQQHEVRRIGDTSTKEVDVRLLLATHRSLEELVARGQFRQDFYYRVNVVQVRIPPLRDRREDVMPLAAHFLKRIAARVGRRANGLTPGATVLLQNYAWPGNVRELENAIERALNVASGDIITDADLPAALTVAPHYTADAVGAGEDEPSRLVAALERARWNHAEAAVALGISRTTLWRKLREHRIQR
jgi:transcriptional regulator with PAS, ATPase and Fis domain